MSRFGDSSRSRIHGSFRRVPALLCVSVALALIPATGAAAFVDGPNDGMPGLLSLRTDPAPLRFTEMSVGDVEYGQIQVVLEDADSTGIWLDAEFTESLADRPGGLRLEAALCDVGWTDIPEDVTSDASPVCETGGRQLLALAAEVTTPDGRMWDLGALHRGQERYVLVTLRMPEAETPGLPELAGQHAAFTFRVEAYGDDPVQPGTTALAVRREQFGLAFTGTGVLGLALVAAAFLTVGVLCVTLAARRRPTHRAIP